MGIFRQLTEKPWENPGAPDLATHTAARSLRPPATAVGLKVFLCVVTVLFSLLVAAYAERMVFEDWRPAPRQWLLWMNTGLLVLSSVAIQWASASARRSRLEDAKAGMLAAGMLAIAFLLGQLVAWRQLEDMVVFDIRNPAVAFFFLITALHGLHLLGGLVAWGRTAAELWAPRPDLPRLRLHVRLCATYWHFLLALWIVLFGLLFAGNDNLGAILAFCGLR